MTSTLLLVAVLALGAYVAGYLVGRADRRSHRSDQQARSAGERLQQAALDRPGNPLLN